MTFEALFARRTFGVRPGLAAVRTAFAQLGEPAGAVPAVHIVGTNGKGSIAAMAEHALRRRGHRTGLFTSPHLQRVTERVRIGGEEVEEVVLEAAVARVLAITDDRLPRPLSFFEVITLAAMLVFDQAGVEFLVAEAGLGGRLDSTRVVDAKVVSVASIDLDHQAYLGETRTLIAAEKAGVFRDRVPVMSVPQHPEVETVLRAAAAATPCALRFPRPVASVLPGRHQAHNAGVALAAASVLDPRICAEDLHGVRWPARFERRCRDGGEWVLDVAHNPAAVAQLVEDLGALPFRDTLVLVACAADKDTEAMARALASVGRVWSVCDSDLGLTAVRAERTFGTVAAPELGTGLADHLARAGRVVVCGSHRLVGAAMSHWLDEPSRMDPTDPR